MSVVRHNDENEISKIRNVMVMLPLVDSCPDKRLGEGYGGVLKRKFT